MRRMLSASALAFSPAVPGTELAEPRLSERRRVAFCAAGLAMLLEDLAPGWRRGCLERVFALEGLLP